LGPNIFTRKLRQPDDVMLRELDGESVLLNLDNGRYYGLDEVGTRLYELLTTSASVEAALAAALAEYEVGEQTLRSDLSALIARLVDEGLLEIADADPGP
jgi:hypothetical protein